MALGLLLPRLRVLVERVEDRQHARRRAREHRAPRPLAEDELVVLAAHAQVLLGARQEPVPRPALAVLVDEGHRVRVLRVVMHVVVLGDGLGVAARLGVRREVVDHLPGAQHAPPVANRVQELLARPDHGLLLVASVSRRGCRAAVNRRETRSAGRPDEVWEPATQVGPRGGGRPSMVCTATHSPPPLSEIPTMTRKFLSSTAVGRRRRAPRSLRSPARRTAAPA